MIPKTLHFVWIGDESKRPDNLIETWKRHNPNYNIRIWGNDEYKNYSWMNRKHMEEMWERELCGVADMMRYEILYKLGGITLDADTICLRPLEDWLLEPEGFATWSNEIANPGLIQNSHLGAMPGHKFFGKLILDINEGNLDGRAWECVGPKRLTQTFADTEFIDLTIYPSHYFTPNHFCGTTYRGTGQVFGTQLWHSTMAERVA